MKRRRKATWVLGSFLLIVLLGLGLLWAWTRPPRITVPPRQYPSPNAYEAYKTLAEGMANDLGRDARFREAESAMRDPRRQASAQAKAYYLMRIRPYLDAYRAYLELPSAAVYEYDTRWALPELAEFRRLAQAEAVLIRDALQAGRADEAVQRAADSVRFAEQIRNEGLLIHYLFGDALIGIALAPLRDALPQIQDARALEQIVQLARDYETRRKPLTQAMQMEYCFGLAFYRDLAEGKLKPKDLREIMNIQSRFVPDSAEGTLVMTGVGIPFVLGSSLKEYEEFHAQARADLAQPMWTRTLTSPTPKRFLNSFITPVYSQASVKEQQEVALVRLMGCAAAIKRHRQRTGAYPASLKALQLGEMATDPFTGKPFVYRRDAKRGFQLYSLGQNKTDDGGRIAIDPSAGDLTPLSIHALPEAQRPKTSTARSAPIWIK